MSNMSDSSSSSTENTDNDWCFISKRNTSVVDNQQVKDDDKKETAVEGDTDKNMETEDSIPAACNTIEENDSDFKKKAEGSLEMPEIHSDSSSDVDIIEGFDNLNSLESIEGSMDHLVLRGPLTLNMHPDPKPPDENPPQTYKTFAINCTPEMIDKEIQSVSVENQNQTLDPAPEKAQNSSENELPQSSLENENSSNAETSAELSEEALSVAALAPLEVVDTRSVTFHFCEKHSNSKARLISLVNQLRAEWQKTEVLIVIGLFLSLIFCCILMLTYTYYVTFDLSKSAQKPNLLEMNVMRMHNSLIRCFGEQQIEALKNNDAELLSSIHCMHNYEYYTKEFEAYLSTEVITFLQNPEDADFKSFVESHPEINLSMIIQQLQYFELFPMPKDDLPEEDLSELFDSEISFEVFQEMRDIIENLTLTNQELQNQIAAYNQKAADKNSDDFIIVKDSKNNDNDENFANDIIIKELKIKITWLHMENEKLQKEINKLHNLQKSRAYCYNDGNVEEILGEEPFKKYTEQEETAEKLKPYLDDLVSTLSSQILNLHTSLANELKEVKRYNELIRNMTMEIRNKSSSHTENDSYSWQQLRENIENIVTEAHQDLKEKISAFQTLNFTDAFNNVVEDNKKNAEYMLNTINQYARIVKEKTQEFLENPIPQLDKDTTVKGFWNIMNNLQDQWHYVKGTVKKIAKNFHPKKDHHNENDAKTNHFEPEGPSGNWYFKKKPTKGYYNIYADKFAKSDWLFKRAAQRERYHRRMTKDRD